jgi:quercetin dioxygenase-like cupin family protein
MSFIHLDDLPEQEPVDGYHVRFVHSDQMTLAYWTVEAGAAIPTHQHPHEQVATVLEGTFELTVDGETRRMGPDDVAVIPSNVPHGGRAVTACRMIDAFQPVREDYRDADRTG